MKALFQDTRLVIMLFLFAEKRRIIKNQIALWKGASTLDIHDLETFLALEQLRNFGRTAEKLFISQTTVSARIKALERELNVSLFSRNTHSVELTPAGRKFLPYAAEILESYENAQQNLRFSNRFDHFLTVAAPDSVWTASLVEALGTSISSHSEILFKIHCAHSSAIIPRILDHTVDLGFILHRPMHTDIEVRTFRTSGFYLVCCPGLALPAPRLTPENITQFPLIHMFWGQTFQEWFRAYYPSNAHMMEVDQTSVLVKFLLAGKGAAFLPERYAMEYLLSGALISIPFDYQDKMPVEQSYAIFLKSNASFLSPLLHEIQRNFDSPASAD